MKNLIKIFCLIFILNAGYTYSQLIENWESVYNGPGYGDDSPSGIALDGKGNIYTAGTSKGVNTGYGDIALVKYNSLGVQQWTVRYNGKTDNTDAPNAIFINNDIIYLAGHTAGTPIILKYDLNGNFISVFDLSGYGSIDYIIGDAQGNVIASGNHLDSIIILKFGINGEIMWHKNFIYPNTTSNICKALKIGKNNDLILSGRTHSPHSFADALLVKFDTNGNMIWSRTYNSIFNSFDSFDDFTVLSDGSICAAGSLADSSSFARGSIVMYSSQGNVLWTYINKSFIISKIATDQFNNIYAGADIYSGNLKGPGVVKFNKNGTMLWFRYHERGEFSEYLKDLKVQSPCRIYISYMGAKIDLRSYSGISKFNSNGILKWSHINESQIFDTSMGTGSLIMAFGDYHNIFTATTGIGNPRKNDFHTVKNTEQYYSVSGYVTFKDNNQPVQSGYVKALYYDESSSGIVTVDSTNIQSNGYYALTNVPKDTIDLMFYQDDEELDFVPTYYVSTIDWREATPVYTSQNLTNINCQVYRINNTANPFNISGQVTTKLDNSSVTSIKDAIVYAKSGGTFRNYGVTNGDGSYITTKLPAGSYELITHRMGFAPVTQNVTITNSSLNNINFDMGSPLIGINIINENIPTKYLLSQNYPNPFNPATTIKFAVPDAGLIKLSVYDILGREIEILANENLSAGTYSVNWDASNFPSGIYFYRLEGSNFAETKKMVLIK